MNLSQCCSFFIYVTSITLGFRMLVQAMKKVQP